MISTIDCNCKGILIECDEGYYTRKEFFEEPYTLVACFDSFKECVVFIELIELKPFSWRK